MEGPTALLSSTTPSNDFNSNVFQANNERQCSQWSGGPGGPTGKLPRRLDRTGRQFSLRPVLGHFRTAGLSEDHGPDKVRYYYAILMRGR